jgi:hypothetical protein
MIKYITRLGPISVLIRQKPSVSYDPFYGGWPILYDHWQSAYAYETRERFCGGVYVVEMSVSFKFFFTFPEIQS